MRLGDALGWIVTAALWAFLWFYNEGMTGAERLAFWAAAGL